MSVDCSIDGAVAIVTINRPEKKNAITFRMRTEFQSIFQCLQDDDAVRAIVLTGAGGNFSAGSDIGEMGAGGVSGSLGKMRMMHRMVRSIAGTAKPVIAAVEGVCIGMCWSIALACDFVIAAEDARFQFAFRHIGLAADGGAAYQLSRYVGIQRAKEILFSGRMVAGAEAQTLGLALESLPTAQVLPRALAMAHDLAAAPTLAIGMIKRQLDAAPGQTFDQALDFESLVQPLTVQSDDAKEGRASFKEKRSPAFRGA